MGYREEIHYETMDYEAYDPHHLIDSVIDRLGLLDDEALAVALDVPVSVIEDMRTMRKPIDPAVLIRLHELTGITISGLRNILGDRRSGVRVEEAEAEAASDE